MLPLKLETEYSHELSCLIIFIPFGAAIPPYLTSSILMILSYQIIFKFTSTFKTSYTDSSTCAQDDFSLILSNSDFQPLTIHQLCLQPYHPSGRGVYTLPYRTERERESERSDFR